jgi:4-oxalocrotonate tautomerase
MPKIHLTVSGAEDPVLAKKLAVTVTSLTKELLNKKPEVTAITISFIPEYLWFINSKSLEELNVKSFYLEIKISDSTNLKDDKAKYIDRVYHSLSTIIPGIDPISYTLIEEVKMDAYGYEGLTIEYKYITSKRN